jgi:hypothetical protein
MVPRFETNITKMAEFAAAERAAGLMGGDWPGIDGARR